ncbi:MAG: DsbA family protein [Bdellovibrionota bacterium]
MGHFISLMLILGMLGFINACADNADSRPNFIFKPAPSPGAALKFKDKVVTEGELYRGAESDIFEAEMKVYEIKMNKLNAFLMEKFMEADPKKKGLSNDEYLDKFIASSVIIAEKDVDKLIVERSIPKEHINDQMRERIKKFLAMEKKKEVLEKWLNEQTKKSPVEVYIAKPNWPVFDIPIEGAPYSGASDAKVTLVEYSDFQCPFCAKGSQIVAELKKKYGNKLKVVFKNFPLPFHKQAMPAALAGLCANEQGTDKFWKMHDKMFGDQSKLEIADLKATAKSIGLDTKKFDDCLDTSKYEAAITKDMEQGQIIEVKSTPTFFVNGRIINGAREVEFFSDLIDEQLAK